jgi:hypothetical protein
VLHAVRVGEHGSDIDHVAIGPGGVFTVNAKHHPDKSIWVGGDTFLVNGRPVPYIRNSRHEARRAARLLTEQAGFPVETTGVIAVMGAHRGFTVKKQPEDGEVLVGAAEAHRPTPAQDVTTTHGPTNTSHLRGGTSVEHLDLNGRVRELSTVESNRTYLSGWTDTEEPKPSWVQALPHAAVQAAADPVRQDSLGPTATTAPEREHPVGVLPRPKAETPSASHARPTITTTSGLASVTRGDVQGHVGE